MEVAAASAVDEYKDAAKWGKARTDELVQECHTVGDDDRVAAL